MMPILNKIFDSLTSDKQTQLINSLNNKKERAASDIVDKLLAKDGTPKKDMANFSLMKVLQTDDVYPNCNSRLYLSKVLARRANSSVVSPATLTIKGTPSFAKYGILFSTKSFKPLF